MTMKHELESSNAPIPPHFQCRNYTGAIVTISMLIACLFAASLYTLDKLNSARQEEQDLRASLGNQIWDVKSQNRELVLEYALLKDSDARQMAQLRGELDDAAKHLGASTGQVLNRARSMVGALEKQQAQQADELQQQIGQKADAQELADVMGSVSTSESQIGSTQRTLGTLEQDLGDARSRLGILASNSEAERQTLQELNGGAYHEFTLPRNRLVRVDQIGLKLSKTNARQQTFSLSIVANDQEIRNRDHNVFEPIIFYPGDVRLPYELVITAVGTDNVAGYIKVPQRPNGARTVSLVPGPQPEALNP
jgi:multidrug efflux pump subunit AcrA (membrane-fusion protein)